MSGSLQALLGDRSEWTIPLVPSPRSEASAGEALDQLLFSKACGAGWDGSPSEEKAALIAARLRLTELTTRLTDRIDKFDADYANPG